MSMETCSVKEWVILKVFYAWKIRKDSQWIFWRKREKNISDVLIHVVNIIINVIIFIIIMNDIIIIIIHIFVNVNVICYYQWYYY